MCKCITAVWKYIWQLDSYDISNNGDSCDISNNGDSYDISNNGDSCDSSDSRQEQTCLQDFTTVCISNRHYLGFGGPWVWALTALFYQKGV